MLAALQYPGYVEMHIGMDIRRPGQEPVGRPLCYKTVGGSEVIFIGSVVVCAFYTVVQRNALILVIDLHTALAVKQLYLPADVGVGHAVIVTVHPKGYVAVLHYGCE